MRPSTHRLLQLFVDLVPALTSDTLGDLCPLTCTIAEQQLVGVGLFLRDCFSESDVSVVDGAREGG